MISERLLTIARCPDCGGRLAGAGGRRRRRAQAAGGRSPCRPATSTCGRRPPSTSRRAISTRRCTSTRGTSASRRRCWPRACATTCCATFLRPGPGDLVIDLGCGSGRMLVWNQDSGACQVGVDVSPFFAHEALAGADLALGDLRRLPFADGAFTKGYALDVFEHLSRDGLAGVLREAVAGAGPGRAAVRLQPRAQELAPGARPAAHQPACRAAPPCRGAWT